MFCLTSDQGGHRNLFVVQSGKESNVKICQIKCTWLPVVTSYEIGSEQNALCNSNDLVLTTWMHNNTKKQKTKQKTSQK